MLARSSVSHSGKKVAVVLAGCGVYDGSEIHEAVFTLNTLSKKKVAYQCFAPNIPQMHVIDHTKGEPMEKETRNVLVESARIARGKIQDLKDLKAADYDGLIFPGGFGAAKNLCDLAVKGPEVTLEKEVERVVKDFHSIGKPMGFCCIAPGIAAKALGESAGVEVTVGSETESPDWPYAGTVGAIKAVGATHVEKPLSDAHVDTKNKVVTSPAYMCEGAPIHEIEESVAAMVTKTVEMM
ncbi:unnamed protein product [Amoebophrya sp. A120]|nr:unnamed protein product [Amoebophrya sp. A120]|eukprot:GSA120T00024625001.1